MRNPFPKIGKVMKYDFMHSGRKLVPVFIALLVVGLLIGIFVSPVELLNTIDSELPVFLSTGLRRIVAILLFVAFYALDIACFILTLSEISRRFKSSMLGEEAYMNLSLPVTIGEHLCGKFFTSFIWLIICSVISSIACILCFIRADFSSLIKELLKLIPEMQRDLNSFGLSIGGIIGSIFFLFVAGCIWLISLFYIVPSFTLLIKFKKGLVKVGSFLAIIFIQNFIFKLILGGRTFDEIIESPGNIFYTYMSIISIVLIIFAAIYFSITYFIFSKKLNLE